MKRKDIITGNIYSLKIDDEYHIYRATDNLESCNSLLFLYNYGPSAEFVYGDGSFKNPKEYKYTKEATQDEIDWFELCEIHGKYISKEDFETFQLREFIKEYLQ